MDENNKAYTTSYPINKFIAVSQSMKQNTAIIPPPIPPIPVMSYSTNIINIPIQYDEGECPFPSIPFTIPLPQPLFYKNYPDHPIKPPKNKIPRSHLETPNNFYKGMIPINSRYVQDYLSMPIDEFYNDIAFSDLIELLLPLSDKEIFTKKMIDEFSKNDDIVKKYLKLLIRIIKCCGFTIDPKGNSETVMHSRFYSPDNSVEDWKRIKNVLNQAEKSVINIFGKGTNYELAIKNYLKSVESSIKAANGIFDDEDGNKKSKRKRKKKNKKKEKEDKEEEENKDKEEEKEEKEEKEEDKDKDETNTITIIDNSNNSNGGGNKYELFKSKYKEYCELEGKEEEEKMNYLFNNIYDLCPTLDEIEKQQFIEDEECISILKNVIIMTMKYIGITFDFEKGITATMKDFQNKFDKIHVSYYIKIEKCIESVFDEKIVEILSDTFSSNISNKLSLSKEVTSILKDK